MAGTRGRVALFPPSPTQSVVDIPTRGESVSSKIHEFVSELASETLVVSANGSTTKQGPCTLNGGNGHNGGGPFEPPSLETFTDMRDLLLLDPIHEVTDAGWPHVAESPDA